jgi:hypothetical protein
MGEVYVKVQLSNATDVELAEQGLLERASVRSCQVEALVDTERTDRFFRAISLSNLG